MKLQEGYNKNRLKETSQAPSQSGTFFHLWNTKSFLTALRWFHSFKAEKQGLSLAWLRVVSDLTGSFLVALGLTKYRPVLFIALFLMITLGGTNDESPETGGGDV